MHTTNLTFDTQYKELNEHLRELYLVLISFGYRSNQDQIGWVEDALNHRKLRMPRKKMFGLIKGSELLITVNGTTITIQTSHKIKLIAELAQDEIAYHLKKAWYPVVIN